jgi:hypothetical protein
LATKVSTALQKASAGVGGKGMTEQEMWEPEMTAQDMTEQEMQAQEMAARDIGPIDYLAVEFPEARMRGEGLAALLDLIDRGIIRLLDLRTVTRETRQPR